MGIHLTKVTAPYLIRKRGMFYLQKRVPTALVRHYGKEFIRKSLRTRDRVTAIRISSQLVSALGKEWSEKLFTMPDEMTATDFLFEAKHTEPVLSAALSDYCTMKGRLDDKRFMVFTQRVSGEFIAIAGDKLISALLACNSQRPCQHIPPHPPFQLSEGVGDESLGVRT